jgi:hypothetical protein
MRSRARDGAEGPGPAAGEKIAVAVEFLPAKRPEPRPRGRSSVREHARGTDQRGQRTRRERVARAGHLHEHVLVAVDRQLLDRLFNS